MNILYEYITDIDMLIIFNAYRYLSLTLETM